MLSNRQLFLSHLAQTTDFPLMLEIERAEGIYMYSPEGKAYLDLISGIGVSNVGHRHPEVLAAVRDQLDRYMHLMVYGEYVQAPQTKLAEALCATLPAGLDNVYLVNSGSEAVEGALKLAKRHTGRTGLISCHNAYHGSSHGALSVGGSEVFKQGYRPLLPGVSHISFGLEEELEAISTETAAIILETVQGEAGVRQASTAYFKALRKRCDETGALLILDEIQAGCGRTGKMWAFEHYGIRPDILLTAKGLGGGMPIGAFITSVEVMADLKNDPLLGHITTFGGHPVSCAAALATVNILQNSDLISTVQAKEKLFHSLLVHKKIKEVRSLGLMIAVQMESFEVLKQTIDSIIAAGVITDWFLFCDDAMRIAPPLTITEKEIEKACSIILEAMD